MGMHPPATRHEPAAAPEPRAPAPSAPARDPGPARDPEPQAPRDAMSLRYLETAPILVHGPVSGRPYRFSDAAPVQRVDLRDAEALLRTRFFRRAY